MPEYTLEELSKHLESSGFKCPGCGVGEDFEIYTPDENVVDWPISYRPFLNFGPTNVEPGLSAMEVVLSCHNCGYISSFNAEILEAKMSGTPR